MTLIEPADQESLNHIFENLNRMKIKQEIKTTSNQIKLVGSNLSANNLHSNMPISKFNRKTIQGPSYSLGSFAISLEEALMWAKVDPFSPLNDGSIINPY